LKPIAVGLLGITHPHASARVRALREIEGVEVVAAADDDPRLNYFTGKYDMEAHDIDGVLQDDRIDAVMVHSKSKDMVSHALRALNAGKSVVVEKPGGGTVNGLLQLAKAETQAAPGLDIQVGYNVRLAQSVTRAKELIDAGTIGNVVSVSARGAALAGEHLTAHLNQPADMGGALWIIGCHMIDTLVSMFGVPETVNARVRKSAKLSNEPSREDSAAALLNYPDMSAAFSFDSHDRLEWFESSRISVYGTTGMIEIGILPQKLKPARSFST
jgi:predicted dehydrogenase